MATQNSTLTQDHLKSLFDYKDGDLYWKISRNNNIKVGQVVGMLRPDGYKRVNINKKNYYLHRLIFIYHNGFITDEIDHIDNNRLNNRIENLRVATRIQNMLNCKINSRNTTGIKGITFDKEKSKFRPYLSVNKKRMYLGCFDSLDDANTELQKARIKYHGSFANHG